MNTNEKNFSIMKAAVRAEFRFPLKPAYGSDSQAAITDYLNRGGDDGTVDELTTLCEAAQQETGCQLD